MDRIFRTALFPFIVITLLVYLGSQTLLGAGEGTASVPYSQVLHAVQTQPKQIESVELQRQRRVVVTWRNGVEWTATNPSEASQLALERQLVQQEVTFRWRDTSDSPWWTLLTALLPFVLLMAFWIFLQKSRDERAPTLTG